MRIVVFGASGKVGRLVVRKLLDDGHHVTVFVHQSSAFDASEQLSIIKSDVHNAAFVESAVRGSDAVISTLGSWHTPTKDILSAAMRSIIPVMQQQAGKRLITVTGSGALAPGEVVSGGAKFGYNMFSLIAKDIIRDAETHLQLLHNSNLDWTVIRAPIMRNRGASSYLLNAAMQKAWETISRGAVAQALVDQLTAVDYLRQAPHIHAS